MAIRRILSAMNKQRVYLETSFVSYLASRPSRDVVTAGHQAITHQWWKERRHDFTLYISAPVTDEAAQGHPEAAEKRLAVLAPIESLVVDEAITFAAVLIEAHAIPEKAAIDALHVAISCVYDIHYLLTWNCKHIANAERYRDIEKQCRDSGYIAPIICTPETLLGED